MPSRKENAGHERIWRAAAAAGVGIIGLAPSGGAASAQSLNDAIVDSLTTICNGMVGSDLSDICIINNSSVPGGQATVDNAGTSGSLSTFTTAPEGTVARHLERERRNDRTAAMNGESGQTGMSGAPDDMEFNLGGLSGFATLNYERADKTTTSFDPGYDSDKYGFTLGADRNFGMFTAGLAFNYSSTGADFKITPGGLDTETYGGLVYASVVPLPAAFVDVSAGYTHNDYSLNRFVSYNKGGATISGNIAGETTGNEFRVAANGGYDFYRGQFTFGPRIGLNYVYNDVDAFSERGTTGLEMAFNSSSFESATTSVGMQGSAAFSTNFGVLVPQVSVAYFHEFANGQQTLTGHLVQDLNATTLRFQNDSPDRNYVGIGAGVVAVLPNGVSAFANYNGTFANSLITTHTFTVGLRKEF